MSKLYCIVNNKEDKQDSLRLLHDAAKSRSVPFELIAAAETSQVQLPQIEDGSMVYRIGTSTWSGQLEALLLNDSHVTLRNSIDAMYQLSPKNNLLKLMNSRIPIPNTILSPSSDKLHLEREVKAVGGYPVVVKAMGFSHGEGVKLAINSDELHVQVGYADEKELSNLMLRQFIDYEFHARIIVLNGEAIDSINYIKPDDDFRTNAVENPNVESKKFSDQIEAIAVGAVSTLGIEFGGADILIDYQGSPYVAEVNFPCNFSRNQNETGTDIAGMIIDRLVEKSTQL